MSEKKHTPGPWRVREVLKWHEDGSSTVEAHQIVSSARTIVTDVSEETDAYLIAAAPEMLQKLHNCVSALTFAIAGMDESDPWITKLRATRDGAQAIIAKAEGQP